MFHQHQGRLTGRRHPQMTSGVHHVLFDGWQGQVELARDFLLLLVTRNQTQNFLLTLCQRFEAVIPPRQGESFPFPDYGHPYGTTGNRRQHPGAD